MPTRPLIALDDVPALALFIDVVARGSLASAARGRGLTTSAVSKRIAQLENRLGSETWDGIWSDSPVLAQG